MSCIPTGYGNPRFPGQLGGYGLRYPEEAAAWTPADLGTDLISEWPIYNSAAVTLNGSDVAAVADTNGVQNLVQATAAKQPALVSAVWNGQDIASFVASPDAHILAAAANATYDQTSGAINMGLFVVLSKDWSSGTQYLFSHYTGSVNIEAYVTASTSLRIQTKVSTTSTNTDLTLADDTPTAIWVGLRANTGTPTSTDRKVWQDGAEIAKAEPQHAFSSSGTHVATSIGGRFNDTFHINSKCGYMAITKYLSDAQLAEYFAWANTKFGLGY